MGGSEVDDAIEQIRSGYVTLRAFTGRGRARSIAERAIASIDSVIDHPPVTVEEFEQAYARRSGTTVEALHSVGRRGAVCDCGETGCWGFQMLYGRFG